MESASQENIVVHSYGLSTSQKIGGSKTLEETLNECKQALSPTH